ncbi:hypothetical protein [Azotobacter chroococcum]|uniref:hypothetical protein n=1 Tax=Azotobacter chroococcum TaxID=353 RepID=UPI001EF08F4D|nr:hypothetical protein [Azotobacter chroococcum]
MSNIAFSPILSPHDDPVLGTGMSTAGANLALLARVNHFLAAKGEQQIKRCQPDSDRHGELGSLYLIEMASGEVLDHHVDIEVFAKKIGVV